MCVVGYACFFWVIFGDICVYIGAGQVKEDMCGCNNVLKVREFDRIG